MDENTLAEQFRVVSQQTMARQLGAIPLVLPILEDLGLWATVNRRCPTKALVDLGRVALLVALNRLLAPRPVTGIVAWAQESAAATLLSIPSEQLYDVRLGRALDALFPVLGPLWSELAARAIRQEGVDLSVLHWDLTSCYFEGEHEPSELARYGYSRDKRPDTKQVNLGLNVTGPPHIPVQYQVLPGNTADCTTPLSNVTALVQFLARPDLAALAVRPLIVSDSKMVTAEAVVACHHHRLTYVGPLPPETQAAEIIRSVTEAELQANVLAYRPQRHFPADDPFVPYRGVWRTVTFRHDAQPVTDRALVVWSARKERLDIHKRKTLLKRLLDGLAQIQAHLNQRQYRRRDYVLKRLARVCTGASAGLVDITLDGSDGAMTLRFAINRSKLAVAQASDGKYVLATNAAHLNADQVLALFKDQDGVEKAIAVLKGPLHVRPFFLQSDARLQGMVFFNLLALLVRAILRLRLQRAGLALSSEQALAAFASLQLITVGFQDGSALQQVAALSERQRGILQSLRLPGLDRYQTDTSLALR